ncbi:Tkp5 protein [Vanderwaltozyma polyspora DSM 70294]|uniref:Tkp5 protein n=1 Tax=Vanderwaltozyma polyspora (strain ATCC 22028 / DSM 70294 / BCRC 21397 / CBS 2163 / NBRC 10782 / NRRL Y-8283 / UCD 57-17) TaxID=436907 RepID=A7TR36_VANPO|nr:Tkp5 protein [Vanderwaltozyma polyspora DSM 70294]EDO15284.1 Tkp5 protein [Vanderwaltozyma polyspora DSM 70294]
MDNIKLQHVAYVPDLPVNLISFRQATEVGGCEFIFNKSSVFMSSPSRKLKKVGSIHKKLYVLDISTKAPEITELSFVAGSDPMLSREIKPVSESIRWYSRFGHPGIEAYNSLARTFSLPRMHPENITV